MAKSTKSSWRQGEVEPKPKSGGLTLSVSQSRRLPAICVESIDLCSKASGKPDPAVGHFVAHSREEALIEVFDFWL